MSTKFPYADPATIEKKRALEFAALSWTEKYERLIQMIRISYEIRQSRTVGSSDTTTRLK